MFYFHFIYFSKKNLNKTTKNKSNCITKGFWLYGLLVGKLQLLHYHIEKQILVEGCVLAGVTVKGNHTIYV